MHCFSKYFIRLANFIPSKYNSSNSRFSKYFILVRKARFHFFCYRQCMYSISLLPFSFHFAVLNFLLAFPCSSAILFIPFIVLFRVSPSRHIALAFKIWFAWLFYREFHLFMDAFPRFNNPVELRTNSRFVLIFYVIVTSSLKTQPSPQAVRMRWWSVDFGLRCP